MSLRNHGWREVVKVLEKHGFHVVRQRGSHIQMYGNGRLVPVPRHDPIAQGTLKAILEQAGISKEDFLKKV